MFCATPNPLLTPFIVVNVAAGGTPNAVPTAVAAVLTNGLSIIFLPTSIPLFTTHLTPFLTRPISTKIKNLMLLSFITC